MAFPCSVYSCYEASSTIAFIIDSNYISHWHAHTFIFTSVSLINSISMIIEIEFDECYKTCDFRDKYNALALPFPLIYHFLSHTISLFLTHYFCPCLLTSLSLFLGPPFSLLYLLLSVCAQLTPSPRQSKGASSTKGACTVCLNNGGGQLLPNEVCLMANLGPSCTCMHVCMWGHVCVWSRCSLILLFHYSASCLSHFYHKTLSDHGTWESNVNRHPPTHLHTHTHTSEPQILWTHTRNNQFDWHDNA